MYERHFSFKRKPFELVPNPDFLFLSNSHKKAITYLDYGIKEKIGFILITGEIGSGKTTIVRNLIKNLDRTIKLSRINNTKVSSEELISMINEDFGLDTKGESKTVLLTKLNKFLIEEYSKGCQPILLIDEAQNLSPDLLEEVRLLSNLETDRAKLIQIILVGQPELKRILSLPELLQLRQRITINYHITPLTMDETARYIKHRLTIAGNPEVINFKQDILKIIYQFSRGIPRLINILCDFVLLSSFVDGKREVTIDTVREVASDLESHDYWNEYNNAVSGTVWKDTESNREIAIRLFKLEEKVSQIVKKNLPQLNLLYEKIADLDKENSKVISIGSNSKITELLERISSLEQICCLFKYKKRNSGITSWKK